MEKWIAGAGVGLTWTTCFPSSDLDSMASGNSVLSSTTAIANDTALDIFCDVSISLGSITTVGAPYIALFLYPLNQDGSTYGDGQFTPGTDSAANPAPSLLRASFQCPVGTQVLVGIFERVIMPPGSFKFLLQNKAGAALASSANVVKYRTYNRTG